MAKRSLRVAGAIVRLVDATDAPNLRQGARGRGETFPHLGMGGKLVCGHCHLRNGEHRSTVVVVVVACDVQAASNAEAVSAAGEDEVVENRSAAVVAPVDVRAMGDQHVRVRRQQVPRMRLAALPLLEAFVRAAAVRHRGAEEAHACDGAAAVRQIAAVAQHRRGGIGAHALESDVVVPRDDDDPVLVAAGDGAEPPVEVARAGEELCVVQFAAAAEDVAAVHQDVARGQVVRVGVVPPSELPVALVRVGDGNDAQRGPRYRELPRDYHRCGGGGCCA
mmetsp:Transcript_36739/g.113286  ORF Transcript_36739/g.113286 Transcript_36739/m.113286 type:complete len:278 (+) Transcript_36739:496-1329(+)